ncbi:MAG TPA: LpqB family beta-propeller domain-containing protein [Micromonospora sp.]
MRRWWAGIAVIAVGVALGGCSGIPENTSVRIDGQGPPPGLGSGPDSAQQPPSRTAAHDTETFVLNFLKAAAGEPSRAVEQVRAYVAPGQRDQVREPKPVVTRHVVRLRERPQITRARAGADEVTLRVQQLGVLMPTGALEPAEERATEYTFMVGSVEGEQGKFVFNPPPVLLLSEDALSTFYIQQAVYFWDLEQRVLVPDLRYLPLSVPLERRRTELLQALLSGPSSWLNKVVQALPLGTKGVGNVPDSKDTLKISLTVDAASPGDPLHIEKLAAQLMWSLGPDTTSTVELTIEGQGTTTFNGTDLRRYNPTFALPATPERFCIYQGRVHRLASSARVTEPVPLLTDDVNHDVVSAGFARRGDFTAAALVVARGERRQLVVGFGRDADDATFRAVGRTFATMGRPVWLNGPEPIGLVPADGQLYQFRTGRGTLTRVALPGATGAVTVVGAAPDGHRIVVVAGGRLYVAALTYGDELEVQPVRALPTSLRNITGADWTSETAIVAAGVNEDGRSVLYDITMDGAIEARPQSDLGTAQVSHLVAYPMGPITGGSIGARMYVANGIAYDFFGPGEEIRTEEVIGAGATSGPARSSGVTAPFFLY